MLTYLAHRILQGIVVLFGVTVIVFLLLQVIPGGEASAVLGPRATSAQIQQFNRVNGLNLPVYEQYWRLVDGYAHFNFGYSYQYNEQVSTLLAGRLSKTLVLVGLATGISLILAIPIGMVQAVRRNTPLDHALSALAFVFYSMPSFLLGTLLILYFAVYSHLLGAQAPQSQSIAGVLADPRDLIAPVLTLAALHIAAFSRYMRSSTMDALAEDYVRTARAKGATPRRILFGHALRNALLPVITLIGVALPTIVGGVVIVESIFNYPGMGLLTYQAITNSDIPVLLGVTVVGAFATVLGSLIADILYLAVDPRIRYV